MPNVIRYIQNQRVHHQTQTFEDEYRGLLDKAGVEYDERYLLDSGVATRRGGFIHAFRELKTHG